jgi:hypothetical protein
MLTRRVVDLGDNGCQEGKRVCKSSVDDRHARVFFASSTRIHFAFPVQERLRQRQVLLLSYVFCGNTPEGYLPGLTKKIRCWMTSPFSAGSMALEPASFGETGPGDSYPVRLLTRLAVPPKNWDI